MGKHYSKLSAVIEADNSEEEIHACLASDPLRRIFPALLGWSPEESVVKSKPSLHEYVPDFAVSHIVKSTRTREWALIEIERPSMPLFTKGGDPRSGLTHAVHQVTTWRRWVMHNIAYARELLPDVSPTFAGIIVIGRRDSLGDGASALAAYNDTLLNARVRTFDWILDKVKELDL